MTDRDWDLEAPVGARVSDCLLGGCDVYPAGHGIAAALERICPEVCKIAKSRPGVSRAARCTIAQDHGNPHPRRGRAY